MFHGSGKSTIAESLGGKVISSDKIREELEISVYNKKSNQRVFDYMHKKTRETLLNGEDCVFDATNLFIDKRKMLLEEVKDIDCKTVLVWVLVDLGIAIARNNERKNPIPSKIIKRMYSNIEIPAPSEKWDEIKIVMDTKIEEGKIEVTEKAQLMHHYIEINYQDNEYHNIASLLAYYIEISKNYSRSRMRYNSNYDACIFLLSSYEQTRQEIPSGLMKFAWLISYFYNFRNDKNIPKELDNEKDKAILGMLRDAYERT